MPTMNIKPKIALIIGSTRAARFADIPAQWMLKQVQRREDLDVELVDLRDFNLPFFDDVGSSAHVPSQSKEAVLWQEAIAGYDGFIFVVAEYNRSLTGALKNALDQAFKGWNHKPFTAIGYGGVGAARAVEHLRLIGTQLHMVSTHTAVHIGGSDFFAVFPAMGNQPIETIEQNLLPSVKTALDDLSWWARATMAARTSAT
jgi:NAD(P)H-dependent FMN reductase